MAPEAATQSVVEPARALEQISSARRWAAELREKLARRVWGQEAALEAVASAYARARLMPGRRGPEGILTFLGPPGVGKTFLAECLAEAIAEVERADVGFRRFDMGSFAGPQNFEQLFGAESYYKGSAPGTLTGFLNDHPRAVIVFDEIEKAHETTIQALLSVLDHDELHDKSLGKSISVRGAWVVFTTNLGRELYARPNYSGVAREVTPTASTLFEILATARPRRSVGDKDAAPALSAEFVSRLSKGVAVLFGELSAGDLVALARQNMAAAGRSLALVKVDDRAILVHLLSLVPRIDARTVRSSAEAWLGELLETGLQHCGEELLRSGTERLSLSVTCADDVRRFLNSKGHGKPWKILLVDED
ncbi:MAG: AAA family ATPase, partial [Candidatus Binatia bacterium]